MLKTSEARPIGRWALSVDEVECHTHVPHVGSVCATLTPSASEEEPRQRGAIPRADIPPMTHRLQFREKTVPQVFFGYPADARTQGETLRLTAAALRGQFEGVEGVTWEDLQVGGRLVIQRVLDAIDAAEMCVFDVTYPNENVLFEVGFAIARGKRVWLTLDSTTATASSAWKDLGILKPIGYIAYRNSADLLAKFVSDDPLSALQPVYDDLIEPVLPELSEPRQALLYCPTFAQFEAANRLSKLVDDNRARGLNVFVSDPQESGLNPITWYAPTILKSAGVLIHFAGKARMRASTHNRRHALVAGLAVGFETPVL